MDAWHKIVPVAAAAVLAAAFALGNGPFMIAVCSVTLLATVGSAVHHAEVVAHRVGEPVGTLILALAVTAIEVALIVSMMIAGGEAKAALARDTIYATVMIISSGVMGVCILLGGLRHGGGVGGDHCQQLFIPGLDPLQTGGGRIRRGAGAGGRDGQPPAQAQNGAREGPSTSWTVTFQRCGSPAGFKSSGRKGSGKYSARFQRRTASLSQQEITVLSAAINSCMTCRQAPQGE